MSRIRDPEVKSTFSRGPKCAKTSFSPCVCVCCFSLRERERERDTYKTRRKTHFSTLGSKTGPAVKENDTVRTYTHSTQKCATLLCAPLRISARTWGDTNGVHSMLWA